MDRRLLIVITSVIGGIGIHLGMLAGHNFTILTDSLLSGGNV